jgi:hypothetical protein
MKFVIRRLVAGVVLIPIVALAYTALYAYLILIGGEPNASIQEVFANGLVFGVVIATALQFVNKFL